MELSLLSSVSPRYLNLFTISTGAGVTGTYYYFFCFPNIEMKVVMLTPLDEVCTIVVIAQNRMVICKKSKNGSVVRVFEISGSG